MKSILACLAMLTLTGCGLKTNAVHLQVPAPQNVAVDLKPIVIDSVTDGRDFSTAPDGAPSRAELPGLMPNGDMSSVIYGAGNKHGGIVSVLADQETVPGVVKDLVSNVLLDRGYKVVDGDPSMSDVPHVSLRVTEFWAFLPFNFGRVLTWTQQMKTVMSTQVTVTKGGNTRGFAVSGAGANIIQVYSEENVRETYSKAMEAYSKDLEAKLFSSF